MNSSATATGSAGRRQPLTALGRLLDLDVRYFHHELTEFVSVDDHTDTSDCRDNNTFMLFTRK